MKLRLQIVAHWSLIYLSLPIMAYVLFNRPVGLGVIDLHDRLCRSPSADQIRLFVIYYSFQCLRFVAK